jgi:hypothetical protein
MYSEPFEGGVMARETPGTIPVEYDNVSVGSDLPVVIADPDNPTQKLAIDSSGRITIANASLSVSTVDAELPAASAQADGQAVPTSPKVGAIGLALGASSLLNPLRDSEGIGVNRATSRGCSALPAPLGRLLPPMHWR